MADAIPIQAGERVSQSRDKKNAAIVWPRAIDRRLDELRSLAVAAGERTTRAELAAAIVCAAPASGEQLRDLLTAYRTKTNKEVLVQPVVSGEIVQMPVHGPGPRTGS